MPKAKKQASGASLATRTLGPLPSGRAGGKGQHFLKNNKLVDAIVAKAHIKATDVVLEIGPGTGIMTVRMLKQAKRVICVELDPRMVAEVHKQVQGTEYASHLRIIHGDALRTEFPYFDVGDLFLMVA